MLQGLEPTLAHPVRLRLESRDLLDDLFGQTPLRLEDGMRVILPVEAIALAELLEVLFLADDHGLRRPFDRR